MTSLRTTPLNIEFVARRLSTIVALVILTLTLIAAVTGILMAFYYQPMAISAHTSLEFIDHEVNYGWLIRRLHDLAGNGLVALGLVQIVTLFVGQRQRLSWIGAWFSGILLTLCAIGLGWTAMILDWSQLGYWRLKVELGTIEAIPFIGDTLAQILTGGSVGSQTVGHMFAIHSYVLSLGAVILSIGHLVSLLYQERESNQV
ncbi:MAG: cytochrome bc complex cytochrome b subunit [Alkalinema sp. FL-bin-369]|nr:cytochrome bc complex cytochrome b subunit [Leptolyngbyaceae cyanobacterium LF-bin-369]